MDNLTHSLTGLFLSRAGLNRFSPRASWILFLAANAPDCDVISGPAGALTYLHYHRNITHSFALLPALALLPVAVVRLVSRKPLPWVRAWLISCAGVLSHLLLDLTNIYGIRLGLPFTHRWYRLDLTSVVDVWIWAVLLLCVAAPALSRLVGGEIGAKPSAGPARAFAWLALAFLPLYNGARAVLHARAVSLLESRVYNGAAPLRAAAMPGAWNPLEWRGLVETSDSVVVCPVDLRQEFDPGKAQIFIKPDPTPAIEKARQTPAFRGFLAFSQFPFWQVLPYPDPENSVMVRAMDMRFGSPQSPAFIATAIIDSELRVVRSWYTFGRVAPK